MAVNVMLVSPLTTDCKPPAAARQAFFTTEPSLQSPSVAAASASSAPEPLSPQQQRHYLHSNNNNNNNIRSLRIPDPTHPLARLKEAQQQRQRLWSPSDAHPLLCGRCRWI